MSVQNQLASTINLAKAMLMTLDKREHTQVPTATLALLLNTIIEFGSDNTTAKKVETAHSAFVAARITGIEKR